MAITRITPRNAEILQLARDRAQLDPTVMPYLTIEPYHEPSEVQDGDWQRVFYADTDSRGWLNCSFTRHCREMSVALWCLNVPGRAHLAGRLMRLLPLIIQANDIDWISNCVAASNVRSMKLVRRVFGEPWGIEPHGAYNRLTGEWEDLHNFKIHKDQLLEFASTLPSVHR